MPGAYEGADASAEPDFFQEIHDTLVKAEAAPDAEQCSLVLEKLNERCDDFAEIYGYPSFDGEKAKSIEELLGTISATKQSGYVQFGIELFRQKLNFTPTPITDLIERAKTNTFDGIAAFREFKRTAQSISAPTVNEIVDIAIVAPGLRGEALDLLYTKDAVRRYARGTSASDLFHEFPEAASRENAQKLMRLTLSSEDKGREKAVFALDRVLRANHELVSQKTVLDLVGLLGPRETNVPASRCIFDLLGHIFETSPELARTTGLSGKVIEAVTKERDVSLFPGLFDAHGPVYEGPTYIDLIRQVRDREPNRVMLELADLLMDDIRNPKLGGAHMPESIDKHRAITKECPDAVGKPLFDTMAILAAWDEDAYTSSRALEYLQALVVDHQKVMLADDPQAHPRSLLFFVDTVIKRRDPLTEETAKDVKAYLETFLPSKRPGRHPSFVKRWRPSLDE